MIVCPRCGDANRNGRQTCWVCDSSLLSPGSPGDGSVFASVFMIGLKYTLIAVGLAAAIAVIIPVLLLVTCFGAAMIHGPLF